MKVLLVGPGGYGIHFLKLLLANTDPEITFEGIVARKTLPMEEDINAAGVPVYRSLEAFYEEHTADMAIICSPSFMHTEQSIYCVEHGTNVLCEKPAAPMVKDVEAMMEAEERTGKFIAIGFQMAYAPATLNLKKDILAGVFGKPIKMKSIMAGIRKKEYFARGGGYAGQIATKDGRMLLDSPAANGCAHYVFNTFFLLGDQMNTSAMPTILEAECYRANDISNFDTVTLKMTAGGVPVYYATSHANEGNTGYILEFEFENAVIRYEDKCYMAYFKDGTVKNYGEPLADGIATKVLACLENIRTGTKPVCTASTAMSHVKMINDLYDTIPVVNFPEEEKVDTEEIMYVANLKERLLQAYEKTCMLSQV